MDIKSLVNLDNVITWRNHIHANPEVAFKEFKTSQYIFDVLTSFGSLEITRPTATSVVALLDTKKQGKTIALRADIDALPMEEQADVSYKSLNDNVAHTCGHDTHTAMLLGAVEYLVSIKEELSGKIKFIFQHAEELPPGGAIDLVNAGVLDGVDMIFGIHIGGATPLGLVSSRLGALTASTDTFEIHLTGKGSHGSTPENAIDLVVVASEIVQSLQTIVSRTVSSLDQAVVTVGEVRIGSAPNIIAQNGFMSGTVRTVNQEVRELVEQRIRQIVSHVCQMHGATVELNYEHGYSSVITSPIPYEIATGAAKKIVGDSNYHVMPTPLMGGEDFSVYTQHVPGSFMLVGGGAQDDCNYFNHHPKFQIMDEALRIGTAINIQTVLDALK